MNEINDLSNIFQEFLSLVMDGGYIIGRHSAADLLIDRNGERYPVLAAYDEIV